MFEFDRSECGNAWMWKCPNAEICKSVEICECDCSCVEWSDCIDREIQYGPQHCFTLRAPPLKPNLDKFTKINPITLRADLDDDEVDLRLKPVDVFLLVEWLLRHRMLLTLESSVKCRNVSVTLTPAASDVKSKCKMREQKFLHWPHSVARNVFQVMQMCRQW